MQSLHGGEAFVRSQQDIRPFTRPRLAHVSLEKICIPSSYADLHVTQNLASPPTPPLLFLNCLCWFPGWGFDLCPYPIIRCETRILWDNHGIISIRPKAVQSGAKGLDGGYEAQVACRGSIST